MFYQLAKNKNYGNNNRKKIETFEERFEMLMQSFKETDALIAKNAEAIKETNFWYI